MQTFQRHSTMVISKILRLHRLCRPSKMCRGKSQNRAHDEVISSRSVEKANATNQPSHNCGELLDHIPTWVIARPIRCNARNPCVAYLGRYLINDGSSANLSKTGHGNAQMPPD